MYSKFSSLKQKPVLNFFKCTAFYSFRKIHIINNKRKYLLKRSNKLPSLHLIPKRNFGLIFRSIKGLLKIRYIVLGSAVGGGYQVKKKYEEFTSNLPDTEWISNLFKEVWPKNFSETFNLDTSVKDTIYILKSKLNDITVVTNKWLEEAKESHKNTYLNGNLNFLENDYTEKNYLNKNKDVKNEVINNKKKNYLEENEKLVKENEELKRQILILKDKKDSNKFEEKLVQRSLIDLYSDVLDELQSYTNFKNLQDILPRVVVVGDQSSGKTSVLEMIANARIFPRGSGEMMTRSPVKVTLSQGPYNIAKFSDNDKEYDLNNENDLESLRNEIEYKMKQNVKKGSTVSSKVISLNIQGPKLNRMVLIDLPGIINTVTTEMSLETKNEINEITNYYISNPNAIILCIQDGSVDVEKSLITDLVSKIDPDGRRTIFVLTKMDLAEKNLINPVRLRKILDGKLFPMKALGYYGVISGKGCKDEKIENIKKYEKNFFKNSFLIKNGIVNIDKCTIENLSIKVSDCFWKMVRSSIEQQADEFNAIRFNLEAEWKSKFSSNRMLKRNELFEKVKNEILDDIINLSLLSSQYWDNKLFTNLWNSSKKFFFDEIFFPTYFLKNLNKTNIELKFQEIGNLMPQTSVNVAKNLLFEEYRKVLFDKTKKKLYYDEINDLFKEYICDEKLKSYFNWEDKAINVLKILQLNALQNSIVSDINQWKSAVNYSKKIIKEKLGELDANLNELLGPSLFSRWIYWNYITDEQSVNNKIKEILEKQLINRKQLSEKLNKDDLDSIKTSFDIENLNVSQEQIQKIWNLLVKKQILNDNLVKSNDCKNGFPYYQHGMTDELDCDHIILFWRLEKMLFSTSCALRMQLKNRELKRFDETIKKILDDIFNDKETLEKLFVGRRVQLVEEIDKVKIIQKKIENFIHHLNKESE